MTGTSGATDLADALARGEIVAYFQPQIDVATGQIVAVDVIARRGADPDVVADSIRAACSKLPAAACPRRIKFVEALATRDHKIVRRPNSVPEASS